MSSSTAETLVYGQRGPFEVTARSRDVGDATRENVSIFGKYTTLCESNFKVGEAMPTCVENLSGSWFIESANIQREDSEYGTASISLVKCSSKSKPYSMSVTVKMAETSIPLARHPDLQDAETQRQIRLWETTPENVRVDWSGDDPAFKFYDAANEEYANLQDVTDENAINYCKAHINGIENFVVYLPVINQVSQYLELPGANVDDTTHKVTGKINADDSDKLGTYSSPPVQIAGFEDCAWFKSGDEYNQNSNGTWTRTEEWTATNDLRFKWIYEDHASTQILE